MHALLQLLSRPMIKYTSLKVDSIQEMLIKYTSLFKIEGFKHLKLRSIMFISIWFVWENIKTLKIEPSKLYRRIWYPLNMEQSEDLVVQEQQKMLEICFQVPKVGINETRYKSKKKEKVTRVVFQMLNSMIVTWVHMWAKILSWKIEYTYLHTFHAKHEHDRPQGVCLDQCCTTYEPISLLGRQHHSVPTISPATPHLSYSFPTYLQFSPCGQAHHSAQSHIKEKIREDTHKVY